MSKARRSSPVLGDPLRLAILTELADGELRVTDLV
jgi:hypothetical protein